MAGKLITTGGVHTVRPGKLVFLKDQLSGALLLADTSAAVSLIPGPPSSGGQALTAANGAASTTGAERNLQLSFLDSNSHLHRFNFDIQGCVDGPILGIDFLRNFGLIVDPLAPCAAAATGQFFVDLSPLPSAMWSSQLHLVIFNLWWLLFQRSAPLARGCHCRWWV